MKTLSLTTVLFLLTGAQAARADHRFYQHLDEHAAKAIDHARDIRWMLRDKLADSRQFRPLLKSADEVLDSLRVLEDVILDEARLRAIHEAVDVAHRELRELDRSLRGCDFATIAYGNTSPWRGGYNFRPATRHSGYVHVTALRKLIRQLDDELDELHDEVEPGYRSHRGGPNFPPRVGNSGPNRTFEIPIGGVGGLVFKMK